MLFTRLSDDLFRPLASPSRAFNAALLLHLHARVFGDTAEERAYGKDYDDSYIRPKVRTGLRSGRTNEETATEGRAGLDPINSGAYARQGPSAIGRSAVTHGSSFSRSGRARIVRPAK